MHRTGIAIAGVVTAAAMTWWVLLTRSPEHTQPSSTATALASAGEVVPVEQVVRFGVPVGWPHDEHGARDAATSAVSLTGEIAKAGFVTRADMIGVLASTRYAPSLIRSSATQLAEVLGDLGTAGITPTSVMFRELVLTATIEDYTANRAVVRVWSVVVAGAPDRGAPRQLWRTVTVELVWESDDWRIDAWSSTPGPTPALATNAPVASLDDLATVAAWPTAGGA